MILEWDPRNIKTKYATKILIILQVKTQTRLGTPILGFFHSTELPFPQHCSWGTQMHSQALLCEDF